MPATNAPRNPQAPQLLTPQVYQEVTADQIEEVIPLLPPRKGPPPLPLTLGSPGASKSHLAPKLAALALALTLPTAVAGCSVLGVLGASSCDPEKADACPEGQRCAQGASGSYYCYEDATIEASKPEKSGDSWRVRSVTVSAGTGGVNGAVTVERQEGAQ